MMYGIVLWESYGGYNLQVGDIGANGSCIGSSGEGIETDVG